MIWRCDLVPQYEAYKDEIHDAIQRVLTTGRYILSSEVENFEKEFSAYLGVQNTIGVANGTDGLFLALRALGVGEGDEVITTPFTAIPTVSAIVDSGAIPKFVDICPDTFLMDLQKVQLAITSKTKAIMPVHIFGNVVDIPQLKSLIDDSISIVEDACQAHGSTLRGMQAGTMGDAGVFSFYPTKNLGGYGDGGAIVTNSAELTTKLRLLRMYGMTDKDHIVMHGINSRLDELQAAVLRVKLKYLNEMNDRRNLIAKRYHEDLKPDLFEHQVIPAGVYSNFHVFTSKVKTDRSKFMQYLDDHEIQTNIYYLVPLHLQKANEFLKSGKGSFPTVEQVCTETIALPMYPEMKQEVQDFVIKTVNGW